MKTLLIDALMGIGVGSTYEIAEAATKAGLATFTGNQHNERWTWDRDALAERDENFLQDLYQSLREMREERSAIVTPEPPRIITGLN